MKDLQEQAGNVGLTVNVEKIKSLRINTNMYSKFQINESNVEDSHISGAFCLKIEVLMMMSYASIEEAKKHV